MIMRTIIFLVLIISIVNPAIGEIVEIDLPGLIGTYEVSVVSLRSADFQFDRLPLTIYGVSLNICGVLHPGSQCCEGGSVAMQVTLGMKFTATFPDTISNAEWNATCEIRGDYFDWSDIEFSTTTTFVSENNATWEFLETELGSVVLSSADLIHNIYLCGCMDHPSCAIESATLIVDADFQVGTKFKSWGVIKSLMK